MNYRFRQTTLVALVIGLNWAAEASPISPTQPSVTYRLARLKTFFQDQSPRMTLITVCEGLLQIPITTEREDPKIVLCEASVAGRRVQLQFKLIYQFREHQDLLDGSLTAAKEFNYVFKVVDSVSGKSVATNDVQATHWNFDLGPTKNSYAGGLTLPLDRNERFLVSDRILFSLDLAN